MSRFFIDEVTNEFDKVAENYDDSVTDVANNKGSRDVEKIQTLFGIDNINLIKPGVGETTRFLLRRLPWKIIVNYWTILI